MQQIAFRNGAIPIEKSVANADWLERREGLARDDCMIRLGPSIREQMLERLVPIASSDGRWQGPFKSCISCYYWPTALFKPTEKNFWNEYRLALDPWPRLGVFSCH